MLSPYLEKGDYVVYFDAKRRLTGHANYRRFCKVVSVSGKRPHLVDLSTNEEVAVNEEWIERIDPDDLMSGAFDPAACPGATEQPVLPAQPVRQPQLPATRSLALPPV